MWKMVLGKGHGLWQQGELRFLTREPMGSALDAVVPAEIMEPGPPVGVLFSDGKGKEMFRVTQVSRLPVPPEGGEGTLDQAWGVWAQAVQDLEPKSGEIVVRGKKSGLSLARVTVSDKGHRGERSDAAGPTIEMLAAEASYLSLVQALIVPDEVDVLKSMLTDLSLVQRFDLVVTTGGTGVAPRDVTPEAALAVIDKRLPGFEQAMTAASLAKTPHGMISRAIAGTIGSTLVITLPGSPKAVAENLAAVLPAVSHTLAKLQGDKADCAGLDPDMDPDMDPDLD
ncbi:MAG: MogA/MoaB family molybdenum cofactor biosynthesis protein [Desulfovibrio sp.]|nr:MAG: MogA/MoaB family molybdenum cofactor biosynthesis protein [Desulfovibrio sp.]